MIVAPRVNTCGTFQVTIDSNKYYIVLSGYNDLTYGGDVYGYGAA